MTAPDHPPSGRALDAGHAFVPMSGTRDPETGIYVRCSVTGCDLGPDDHLQFVDMLEAVQRPQVARLQAEVERLTAECDALIAERDAAREALAASRALLARSPWFLTIMPGGADIAICQFCCETGQHDESCPWLATERALAVARTADPTTEGGA